MMSADISTSYLRSFSSGDPIVVANHVTDDFENNQMGVFGESIKGKTAYIQRLKPFLAKFKDLRYSTSNIIAEAEKVALAYDMTCSVDEHPKENEVIDVPKESVKIIDIPSSNANPSFVVSIGSSKKNHNESL